MRCDVKVVTVPCSLGANERRAETSVPCVPCRAAATVFAVTMILLFDIVAAGLVTATILVVIVEIFGVMGFMAIKFSALPAVSLIMSVRPLATHPTAAWQCGLRVFTERAYLPPARLESRSSSRLT